MHQIGETEDDLFDEIEEELAKVEDYIESMEGPKQAALDVLEVLHTVVDEVHTMIHSSAQGESADGESADAESADGESADTETTEGEAVAELVDLHELIDLMLNEIVETAKVDVSITVDMFPQTPIC